MSKDGGPAFPVVTEAAVGSHGLSLRDYFAGQALAGMLGAVDLRSSDPSPELIAGWAYGHADAMLREREEASDV